MCWRPVRPRSTILNRFTSDIFNPCTTSSLSPLRSTKEIGPPVDQWIHGIQPVPTEDDLYAFHHRPCGQRYPTDRPTDADQHVRCNSRGDYCRPIRQFQRRICTDELHWWPGMQLLTPRKIEWHPESTNADTHVPLITAFRTRSR